MRQPHELRRARPTPAARRSSVCGVRSGPRPRSHSSQTSGASRRCRQSVAGVTRSAAKSASHGGLVPLRHATRRHARGRQRVAERADADGLLIGPAPAAIARRRLRRDRCAASGVPRNTVSVGEMPKRIRQPQPMQRLADRAVVAVFGIGDHRRQRHAGRPRAAHQRQGQPPFLLKRRRSRESAPPRAAPDRSSTPRADTARRPSATRAGPSTARRSPRLGNSPPCPGRRSTAAPRRPNAGPDFGKARFVEDQNARCAPGSRPAAAATPPRHPTAHA